MRNNGKKIVALLLALLCIVGVLTACGNEGGETGSGSSKCDHIEGAWIVDKEATLNSTGKRHTECTICGETVQSETIPKETCAHSNTKWVTDVQATLDSDGSKHLECKDCGKTIKTEVIPELYLTQTEIITKLSPSVVKVICYDYDGKTEMSQGSGFFIDKQGTFITNAHVVEDCYFIKVKTHLGATYDVDVMCTYNNTYSDYAICKVENYYLSQPVEFTTEADVGDTVYALGYPNDAFIMNTTSGKITNTDAVDGTKHYYANTAWIDHGSSGGILADSKGRVLGITTGIFSDGEYAALKYQDFKFDAEGIHISGREPVEYFHTVKEYDFSSFSMPTYFDIIVDVISYTDTSVYYRVWVQLKEQYLDDKIVLDSYGSATITIKLETEYDYYEVKSYGTSHQTKTTSDTIYFYFYSADEMKSGKSMSSSSSIFISSMNDYYGMDISYEADFYILQSGTIIIYD